ncbi:universal stress protein [Nocardia sp. NPDC058379]|uniref:universal stress protein n=1 Tax=unclassified Nocardia TaxID=2637762 RepID=UPI00364978C1
MTDGSEPPGDRSEVLRVDGPAGPTAAATHLVVGYDRHRASDVALGVAIGLATRLGAHLHVVHVIDADDLPTDPDAADWERAVTETVERERAAACARLAELPGNWTYYARRGNPAHLLDALAETYDASMIVIGAPRHGLPSLIERLLGASVSAHLVHHAHRPVLLVPAGPGD